MVHAAIEGKTWPPVGCRSSAGAGRTAHRVRPVTGRSGAAAAGAGARLGGAVGLWHGGARRWEKCRTPCAWPACWASGGEGQCGRRGAKWICRLPDRGQETSRETLLGFLLPEVTGTAQLHNVRAMVRGLNGPIEISSAELQLTHDEARVEKLSARAADAHWTGSVALPRGCGTPGTCLVRFNLNTDELDLSELSEWLSSHPSQRRWYQMLTSAAPAAPSFLESLRASGKVNAGRLLIHNLVAERVSASLDLERGKLKISDYARRFAGGKASAAIGRRISPRALLCIQEAEL